MTQSTSKNLNTGIDCTFLKHEFFLLKSFHLAPPKLHISWITTEEKENGRNYGTTENGFFFHEE
jgi:hypothetical protein